MSGVDGQHTKGRQEARPSTWVGHHGVGIPSPLHLIPDTGGKGLAGCLGCKKVLCSMLAGARWLTEVAVVVDALSGIFCTA